MGDPKYTNPQSLEESEFDDMFGEDLEKDIRSEEKAKTDKSQEEIKKENKEEGDK